MNLKTVFPMTLALCMTACSSGPPPTLYIIDDPQPVAQSGGSFADSTSLGVFEVTLPTYARGEKLARYDGPGQIVHLDDHRWAEPPEEAITTALARSLARRLDDIVIQQPYPRGLRPTQQVRVVFERFVVGPSNEAQLSGHFLLFPSDGDRAPTLTRFDVAIPANGSSYADAIEAFKSGVNELARRIAQTLGS